MKGEPLDAGFKSVGDQFIKRMADEAVSLMHDDERWLKMSRTARRVAEQWTWAPVADDWVNFCHEIIEEKSSDPRRLVKHFLINSDVVAAQKYVAKNPHPVLEKSVDRYIDSYVPFVKANGNMKEEIAKFYEERSGGERANWQTGFFADNEPRLRVLMDWLKTKKDAGVEIKSLLDFGCAHGGYARAISNEFPDIKVWGVDVSPSLVRCANELKSQKMPDGTNACKYPDNLNFVCGDVDGAWYSGQPFDVVVCMEVLEHLPFAEEAAKRLEQFCKPEGYMAFTVPFGHRERDEFVNKHVPPVHVRAFDLHDLRDLFGKRGKFSVVTFSDLQELELDHTFAGWFMVTYQNDERVIGEIDWERKFKLQGPQETLAVCMIVHNNEDVMHRALRSIHKIADQIVIVDNGPSTDRTVAVAQEYTRDVRAGTNPFYCYAHMGQHAWDKVQAGVCEMAGFETPRNESIDDVWADWIWWIDSDEQLMEAPKIPKYLRQNVYFGYAIQQHHLSVEPPGALKKDIPVRLFRNHVGMRFYGLVHEHAEIGLNKGIGPDCAVLNDINISHDGYLTEQIRRGRFHRNINLLKCDRLKYPDRPLGIYLYDVRDNIHMARYALEKSNGQVTQEIKDYCWTVINTFRANFMGKEMVLAKDGLQYYSDALAILGLGIEVSASMDIKKEGAIPNTEPYRFRAMDSAEVKRILASKVEQLAAPFEGPYVN